MATEKARLGFVVDDLEATLAVVLAAGAVEVSNDVPRSAVIADLDGRQVELRQATGECMGAQALLVTGVFGSGKSAVAAEIADLLEKRGCRYVLLDLDYLAWGFAGSDDAGAEHQMMLRNVKAVVANFLAAGVRYFVLARFIRDVFELDSLRTELRMPLRVVRLDVPFGEIQRRLTSDPTTARRDDLRDATLSIAAKAGVGLEDLVVSNNCDVREVASEILDWLNW